MAESKRRRNCADIHLYLWQLIGDYFELKDLHTHLTVSKAFYMGAKHVFTARKKRCVIDTNNGLVQEVLKIARQTHQVNNNRVRSDALLQITNSITPCPVFYIRTSYYHDGTPQLTVVEFQCICVCFIETHKKQGGCFDGIIGAICSGIMPTGLDKIRMSMFE